MSRIGIIGTGSMAQALGAGWASAGHRIRFGSRQPANHHSDLVGHGEVVDPPLAIEGGDVVVLAIPYPSVEPFAAEHAHLLRSKLVIDISNPFNALQGRDTAGARITADAIGGGARVVAAFKDNFAATLHAEVRRGKDPADVRIAGDSDDDKAEVAALAEELHGRPLDCGPLDNGRYIDQMVSLMLLLDRQYADGTMRSGWKFTSNI